jgi:tRNA threonylcarbamoyladenosine biosynthesis protein TsaB
MPHRLALRVLETFHRLTSQYWPGSTECQWVWRFLAGTGQEHAPAPGAGRPARRLSTTIMKPDGRTADPAEPISFLSVLLLAFDTATPAITVALHDGERALAETTTLGARRHGETLTPSIAGVLAEAGVCLDAVTAVAVGTGPGPYTGLRVGVMTARALGAAMGVPVYGICTLDAIAHAVVSSGECQLSGPFVVATDARRKEVYWACYAAEGTRLSGPAVNRPAELPPGMLAAGSGGRLYPEAFGGLLEPQYPPASALAALAARRIADGTDLLAPQPLYLRLPDARVPGPIKAVTPR